MPQQRIIWTALPNGMIGEGASRRLRLSVFVSPRLRLDAPIQEGTLAAFGEFLDWPARLRDGRIRFEVVVDDARPGSALESVRAQITAAALPDSNLWRAFFPAETFVRSHAFEPVDEPIQTNPTGRLERMIQNGYRDIGQQSPFVPPDRQAFLDRFPDVARAIAPQAAFGPRLTRERLQEATIVRDEDLVIAHREVAENMLRADPLLSIDDKLAAAITIAGRRARSGQTPDVPVIPTTDDPASAIAQFVAFHRQVPATMRRAARRTAILRRGDDDRADFHQMVSALSEYPTLLRRLGLVIDLEVPAADIPQSIFGQLKRVRVVPTFTPASPPTEPYTPATNYIHDVRTGVRTFPFPVFAAAPRRAAERPGPDPVPDLEIVAGLLNLGLTREDVNRFHTVQIDVDGIIKKLVNAIRHDARDSAHPEPVGAAATAGAPALRTSGLSLVRTDYAHDVAADIGRAAERQSDLEGGRISGLFAEDLVRGYRIDVRRFPPGFAFDSDATPPWMSLHKRAGSLSVQGPDGQERISISISDEGFLQPAVVQDPHDAAVADAVRPLRIQESFFHWQGWSLSAPPPGGGVDLGHEESVGTTSSTSARTRIVSKFDAEPRSLPRLRFGSTYQVRARTVDLAGNGPTAGEADAVLHDLAASDTRPPLLPFKPDDRDQSFYRRFEPIAAPTLVPREELTEGETINVMVIRSDGQSTAEYAATLRDPRYHGTNERHIVPPKATQAFAETHGLLDRAFGPTGDPTPFITVFGRAERTLNDDFVIRLDTGEPEKLADVVLNEGTSAERRIPHGVRFIAAEAPAMSPDGGSVPGSRTDGYTIHYEAQLRLPYLPDPLARGAALFGLPGVRSQTVELVEGTMPGSTGTLTFFGSDGQVLPELAIRQLGFVTKIGFPDKGGWPDVLPFRLRLDGTAPGAAFAPPEWGEESGARVLTVRLAPGKRQTIWVSSYPHESDVPLLGAHWLARVTGALGPRHSQRMAQHGALALVSPAHRVTLVHATQRPVMAPTFDPGALFHADRLRQGETAAYIGGRLTIHRPSTERIDVVATWTEHGEGPGGHQPRTLTGHVLEVPIHLEDSPLADHTDPMPIATYRGENEQDALRVTLLAPATPAEASQRRWLSRHEFGDTRHRKVTYEIVATTRYREYFPSRITSSPRDLTRSTRIADVIVRSSARPPAPEISLIVPTFGWSEEVDGVRLVKSTRIGSGLRVYLGARWNASGDDERLAIVGDVVLGADPLHQAPGFSVGSIRPSGTSVTVGGAGRITHYPVHYHEESGEWFSDLTFEVEGAYFPFVRLTLARYQEHSLDGLRLSAAVHAGLRQIAPDRQVAFKYFDVTGRPELQRIDITVVGDAAPAARLSETSRHIGYRVEVSLEQRDAIFPDPDLGWTAASPNEQPTVASTPPSPPVLWSGVLIVARDTGSTRRLVVREFELFPRTACPPELQSSAETDDIAPMRLVYVDTIPL